MRLCFRSPDHLSLHERTVQRHTQRDEAFGSTKGKRQSRDLFLCLDNPDPPSDDVVYCEDCAIQMNLKFQDVVHLERGSDRGTDRRQLRVRKKAKLLASESIQRRGH